MIGKKHKLLISFVQTKVYLNKKTLYYSTMHMLLQDVKQDRGKIGNKKQHIMKLPTCDCRLNILSLLTFQGTVSGGNKKVWINVKD